MKGKIKRLLAAALAMIMTVSMVSTDVLATGGSYYSGSESTPAARESGISTYAASSFEVSVGGGCYNRR